MEASGLGEPAGQTPGNYPFRHNDGFSEQTYWHPGEVQARFDALEADNVKHGPSDGRVSEQHALQTHLGNPDWVKGYQEQPHQPGPKPQDGAPTHYERTHPNGYVERQHADLIEKVLRTGDPRGKEQWHRDEDGNVHTHHEDGTSGVFRPVTASGLGMPPGPLANAAEKSVTQTNVPQQVAAPMAPEQFMGPGPVPTNQSTTKPRQQPGGGSGGAPGVGGDIGFDPKSNGADVATEETEAPPEESGPPVQAKKASVYVMADIMADIVEANPGVGERMAYHLAKRVVDEYPLTKQAEGWNPLSFGNRGNMAPTRLPVPERSPSRLQETVQPEHAQQVLEGSAEPKALEGTVIDPPEPAQIEAPPRRKMTMDVETGEWDWDRPDPWIERQKAGTNA